MEALKRLFDEKLILGLDVEQDKDDWYFFTIKFKLDELHFNYHRIKINPELINNDGYVYNVIKTEIEIPKQEYNDYRKANP